jgi:hypothetical protein
MDRPINELLRTLSLAPRSFAGQIALKKETGVTASENSNVELFG